MSSILETFGTRVKYFREQQGLSQGDVERKSGILRCYLSRIENRKNLPLLSVAQKIAKAIGVPLWCLLLTDEEFELARRKRDERKSK